MNREAALIQYRWQAWMLAMDVKREISEDVKLYFVLRGLITLEECDKLDNYESLYEDRLNLIGKIVAMLTEMESEFDRTLLLATFIFAIVKAKYEYLQRVEGCVYFCVGTCWT